MVLFIKSEFLLLYYGESTVLEVGGPKKEEEPMVQLQGNPRRKREDDVSKGDPLGQQKGLQ